MQLAKTNRENKRHGHGPCLFSFFLFSRDRYSVFRSLSRVQPLPILTQACLNRSSIAGGHNHEIPEIHQQDSSYREAQ